MRDRFSAADARAQQMRFHTQTAGSTLTAQQPDNNIVRVSLQALAAVLGGTQSLHCNGRDEALSLPTEESARIALRTQQIIAWETGVANTVDPVGGSIVIERLTDDIERGAVDLLAEIERQGGTLAAIESGFIQRQIQESAYRAQMAIDSGTSVVVGINRFTDDDRTLAAASADLFRIDPAIEADQVNRLRALRRGRNTDACGRALDAVSASARGDANLVPAVIGAVEARATVGEIADALRSVFGQHDETATF
jgi:methylmalonyl-CoA mutase N-terminal domain/subunit